MDFLLGRPISNLVSLCEGTETTNTIRASTYLTQICHSEHVHNLPYPKGEKIGQLDAKDGHFCKFKNKNKFVLTLDMQR